jgi:hypothetical protein
LLLHYFFLLRGQKEIKISFRAGLLLTIEIARRAGWFSFAAVPAPLNLQAI